MSWKTPTVADGYLREAGWSTGIAVDSPEWYAWLDGPEHYSFHVNHPAGGFTARKERKQRGQWYWIAYRQFHGKLYKQYLGKSEHLDAAHIDAAARALAHAAGADDAPT